VRFLRWLRREPLVIFFAVGAILFLIAPGSKSEREVHLSTRALQSLEQAEARRRGVSVLPAPVAAAVRARAIDDELLYREGLRLGVDQNDNIVRQRVIEKMLFLAEDLAGASRPVDDGELSRFLGAHAEEFRRQTIVSFVQVYAASDPARLSQLLPTLAAGTQGASEEAPSAGDAFPTGRRTVDASLDAVKKSYGTEFAATVEKAAIGTWSGPIASPFGHHLVKVTARRDGGIPALAEVRDAVRLAYLQERKDKATAEFLRGVRARYRVVVDDRDSATGIPAPREAD
jgi:hypothetical protein